MIGMQVTTFHPHLQVQTSVPACVGMGGNTGVSKRYPVWPTPTMYSGFIPNYEVIFNYALWVVCPY